MTTTLPPQANNKILVEPSTLIRRCMESKTKASKSKKRAKTSLVQRKDDIYFMIMSSHVRGLECWHSLIRTGIVPFTIDCLVHVDSHPDLMLPKGRFPLDDPRAVYELLETSRGGIAEWLFPAMFAGHCSRLVWLRAKWCDQIRDGIHELYIGSHVKDGSLRVTCLEPYFCDEPDTYSPLEDLKNVQKVTLLVTTVESIELIQSFIKGSHHSSDDEEDSHNQDTPPTWMLDVCLDYFAVTNPFLDHACKLFGEKAAMNLQKSFLNVRWRAEFEKIRCEKGGGLRSPVESKEKAKFEAIMTNLVRQNDVSLHPSLKELFTNGNDYENLIECLQVVRDKGEQGALVALELMESPGLPHHPHLDLEQQKSFFHLLNSLSELPPVAGLIARSDEDEYTPKIVCENIEKELLTQMQTIWKDKVIEPICVEVEEEEEN